jgi:hypothetical protein
VEEAAAVAVFPEVEQMEEEEVKQEAMKEVHQ